MQTLRLPRKLYQVSRIDEAKYSNKVYYRLRKVESLQQLQKEGCSLEAICLALETPLSTLYRWRKSYKLFGLAGLEDESRCPKTVRETKWKHHIVQKVLYLRKQNPIYGKNKIAVLLKRDHRIHLSASTVGRIITYLIKKDQIKSAFFYCAKKRVRPRRFNGHAQRLPKGIKAKKPGELLQIDHMSMRITSEFGVKHFQAVCPITKIVTEQVYSRATSVTAKKFLLLAQEQLPFKIKSIQVDGGSEFMKDFEQACQDLNIPLYVLPPKSPECNGNVERANGAAKFEFYTFYTDLLNLSALRKKLKHYVRKYNSYRPHQALQYLTPLQYYATIAGA